MLKKTIEYQHEYSYTYIYEYTVMYYFMWISVKNCGKRQGF